ncbi:hypothetical protein DEO72_LG8g2570 [Vigna unguiculata]|uniref:Uncharacterized protein n=1 Tax=Vigna unguiculata TaxID=3917 RepID=A0A4D6MUV9_VIGUN|nr:hypothetical protein DEO72_LG8g2570 [Vigna unguiculata]
MQHVTKFISDAFLSNTTILTIQEHCGRVRGLGLGLCPSKVFGSKGHSYSGTSSSYPSNAKLQNQVSTLTSQLNEMKAMVNFLVSDQGSVPNEETNDRHQATH